MKETTAEVYAQLFKKKYVSTFEKNYNFEKKYKLPEIYLEALARGEITETEVKKTVAVVESQVVQEVSALRVLAKNKDTKNLAEMIELYHGDIRDNGKIEFNMQNINSIRLDAKTKRQLALTVMANTAPRQLGHVGHDIGRIAKKRKYKKLTTLNSVKHSFAKTTSIRSKRLVILCMKSPGFIDAINKLNLSAAQGHQLESELGTLYSKFKKQLAGHWMNPGFYNYGAYYYGAQCHDQSDVAKANGLDLAAKVLAAI